jgi:hypothetical protein
MRQLCPNDERLIDYIEGRLSEEERSDLEIHLSVCEMCLEELVITNNIVARKDIYELEQSPSEVTDAAVNLVADRSPLPSSVLIDSVNKFFSKLGSYIVNPIRVWPWGRWNPAPLRGVKVAASEDYVCLEVSFKDLKTEIEIEKTGINKANIRLRLNQPIKNPKSLRVTLKNGERELASYLLDGTYVFFEDIPFGHYSISLAEDNVTIETYSFEIKESYHGGKETKK